MRRLLAALAVAALVWPAAAAANVRLRGIDTSDFPRVRVTVVTSKPTKKPPTVKEDGQPAAGLQAENLGREKSVLLLLDRSRSMRGKSLTNAIAAIRAFVRSKRPADRIAVVTFGSRAGQVSGFSSSTIDADSALRSIEVDGRQGTALYDAIVLGAQALRAETNPGRVILVVTDGKDISSNANLRQAVAAARKARAVVFTVGIEGPQFTPGALRAIARRTGGVYRGAKSTTALKGIYATIGRELERTWRLEYLTAGRGGEKHKLVISAAGQGSVAVPLSLPEGVGGSGSGSGSALPSAFYAPWGTAVLALAIGLLALLAVFLLFSKGSSKLVGRLRPHVAPRPTQVVRAKRGGRQRLEAFAGLFRATENAFGHTRHWRKVQRLLERADLPLKTVEFFYIVFGGAIVLGFLGAVSAQSSIVILILMAVGGAIPFGWVWYKARRRLNAFENQLPDLLISIAASLKAGHSFKQAIQGVVEEGYEPSGRELKRVLTETRLGRPMEDALAEMADRVGSENFAFIVTAVTLQSQVGGSLAGIFDMVADTVRNRQQFQRKIRALTAMGRMSAYVLVGLPFFMAGAISLINPGYMSPLFHSSTGHKLIFTGLSMMTFGSLILKKMVSFKG